MKLELGRLYFKVVDFETAVRNLKDGLKAARAAEDWPLWCQYLPLLLRIYAERMDFAAIAAVKEELATVRADYSFEESTATCYAFGIAAAYEAKLDEAEQYFTRAHQLAFAIEEQAQARFGLAAVSVQRRQYQPALEQLRGIEWDLASTLLTDLKLATGLLAALCLRDLGEVDAAFDRIGPLQEICRSEQNLFMSLNILYALGTLHQKKNENQQARQYFAMVLSLTSPTDLKHIATQVERKLAELGSSRPVMKLVNGQALVLPQGTQIPIRGQFVLADLLRILGQAAGDVLSKEDIVRKLWKQEYNPLIHDNKIYVTIRRLRRMLEPESATSSFIHSAQDGYRFNPNIEFKILA